MDKTELRSFFSARRQALTMEQRREYDRLIREKICRMPEFTGAFGVMAFVSFGAEPDLLPLAGDASLYLPRYEANEGIYRPVRVEEPATQLVKGHYGIPEPHPGLPAVEDEVAERLWFLVPAVSCDRFGTRLGRGGGWYDRLLRRTILPPTAVIYSCQLADQPLPREEHDIPVKRVVTELEVLDFQL